MKPTALESLGVEYPQTPAAEIVPQRVFAPGPGPDGTPDRRRYPAMGKSRRTAVPPGHQARADDPDPEAA